MEATEVKTGQYFSCGRIKVKVIRDFGINITLSGTTPHRYLCQTHWGTQQIIESNRFVKTITQDEFDELVARIAEAEGLMLPKNVAEGPSSR